MKMVSVETGENSREMGGEYKGGFEGKVREGLKLKEGV